MAAHAPAPAPRRLKSKASLAALLLTPPTSPGSTAPSRTASPAPRKKPSLYKRLKSFGHDSHPPSESDDELDFACPGEDPDDITTTFGRRTSDAFSPAIDWNPHFAPPFRSSSASSVYSARCPSPPLPPTPSDPSAAMSRLAAEQALGLEAVNTFFETKPHERCGVLWQSASSDGSASGFSQSWASSSPRSDASTAPSSAAPSPTKATRSSGGFACDRDGNPLFDRDLPPLPTSATRRVSEADAAFAAPKSFNRPSLFRGRSHTLSHASLDGRVRARSSSLAAMANELALSSRPASPIPPVPQRALPPTPQL